MEDNSAWTAEYHWIPFKFKIRWNHPLSQTLVQKWCYYHLSHWNRGGADITLCEGCLELSELPSGTREKQPSKVPVTLSPNHDAQPAWHEATCWIPNDPPALDSVTTAMIQHFTVPFRRWFWVKRGSYLLYFTRLTSRGGPRCRVVLFAPEEGFREERQVLSSWDLKIGCLRLSVSFVCVIWEKSGICYRSVLEFHTNFQGCGGSPC